MIFASNQHQQLWEACTDTFVNTGRVINIINTQPQLLKDHVFRRQLIEKVSELEENSPLAENAFQYTNIKVLLHGKVPLRKDIQSKDTIYAYLPHNSSADIEEKRNQEQVSERFFRVNKALRHGQPALQLYHLIRHSMQNGGFITLDGYSMRSVVTALVKIISENNGMPNHDLHFKIGPTDLICKRADKEQGQQNACVRQKANFWLSISQLPDESFTYGIHKINKWEKTDRVGVRLGNIAPTAEKQRNLSMHMSQKTRVIASFTENDFNLHTQILRAGEDGLNAIRNPQAAQRNRKIVEENIHYLNGLNFLRSVTEVVRRLYRNPTNGQVYFYQDGKARRSDALPIAVHQARSSLLLSNGHISQMDVFGESSAVYGQTTVTTTYSTSRYGNRYPKNTPTGGAGLHRAQYGIATGVSTIENVDAMEDKANRINAEIETNVIRPSIGNGAGFFKVAPVFDGLNVLNGQEKRQKAGKNHLRVELGQEFGGDYESDGDNYSDDEDVNGLNDLFENRFGI